MEEIENMKGIEKIILKWHTLCKGCSIVMNKGEEAVKYSGPGESLHGVYCRGGCIVDTIKASVYEISEEDLPKSQ